VCHCVSSSLLLCASNLTYTAGGARAIPVDNSFLQFRMVVARTSVNSRCALLNLKLKLASPQEMVTQMYLIRSGVGRQDEFAPEETTRTTRNMRAASILGNWRCDLLEGAHMPSRYSLCRFRGKTTLVDRTQSLIMAYPFLKSNSKVVKCHGNTTLLKPVGDVVVQNCGRTEKGKERGRTTAYSCLQTKQELLITHPRTDGDVAREVTKRVAVRIAPCLPFHRGRRTVPAHNRLSTSEDGVCKQKFFLHTGCGRPYRILYKLPTYDTMRQMGGTLLHRAKQKSFRSHASRSAHGFTHIFAHKEHGDQI
jgi:hypothetical protein